MNKLLNLILFLILGYLSIAKIDCSFANEKNIPDSIVNAYKDITDTHGGLFDGIDIQVEVDKRWIGVDKKEVFRILSKILSIEETGKGALTKQEDDFIKLNIRSFFYGISGYGKQRVILVKKILYYDKNNVMSGTTTKGTSPMIDAVKSDDGELLSLYLDKKLDLSDYYNKYGISILEVSVLTCQTKSIEAIIASPNRDNAFCADCLKKRHNITLGELVDTLCPKSKEILEMYLK